MEDPGTFATDFTDEFTTKTFFTTKDTKYTKKFFKVFLKSSNSCALGVLRGEKIFLHSRHRFSLNCSISQNSPRINTDERRFLDEIPNKKLFNPFYLCSSVVKKSS